MKRKDPLIIRLLIVIVMLLFLVIIVSSISLPKLPDNLNSIAFSTPTQIYADNGQLVKILANREFVSIKRISPFVIQAVVDIEDPQFYSHHGISKRAVVRAMFQNLKYTKIKEGGSTITQQLVKNLFFSFNRNYLRKVQEALLTVQVERQFSKEEILEAYLNQIDFGSGTYGIEMASQTYFAKHADELMLAEAAMLAGIPRWPARYNPYQNEEIARERFVFVLARMKQSDSITEEQFTDAMTHIFDYRRINPIHGRADYFIDQVLKDAEEKYDENAVRYGGLKFNTTINTRYQYYATLAVQDGLKSFDEILGLTPYEEAEWDDKLNYPQAALVAVNPRSGAVKAMVGGRDFQRSPFNRAVSNNRQPGSVFKPFTYLVALEKNLVTPVTVMVDEPVKFEIYNQVWTPQNYDHGHQGPLVLKKAIMLSNNVITAKLIDKVTPAAVVEGAHDLGISSTLEPNMSLALGATAVSPLEMAVAYSTIANQGIRWYGYMVQSIIGQNEAIVDEWEPNSERVFHAQSCYLLIDMLKGVVEQGTAQAVRSMGFLRPCAGKTGTTSDYRDAWFVGFTPELVTVVWIGFDDNRVMNIKSGGGVTGSMAALPIWVSFMQNAVGDLPFSDFPIPPGIVFDEVDPTTGTAPASDGLKLPVALRQ